MTERERGIQLAAAAAKALNKRFGVRSAAHIKVEAYAAAHGLKVIESKLDGALARLMPGPKPVIRVSDRPCHPGDRTFGIGHELGHHVLEHPPTRVDTLCKHPAQPYRPIRPGTARHPEAEANTFAAELCMPSDLLTRTIAEATPSLEIAHAIAKEYKMPLTATAIRFAELTRSACAAIYSEVGRIVWAVPSGAFTAKLQRGKRLDEASIAYTHARDGRVDERSRGVRAKAWIATELDEELVEHSVVVAESNGVITLLWVPEPVATRLGMTIDLRAVDQPAA
ncbi:MAG TPA: ImmA/IrrE family metallo-endopeptidase [Kofleriaceae bacterium]|nr:ImmA/IrrE family metallo-endopeptidase [Kofleriaceae bacterium]